MTCPTITNLHAILAAYDAPAGPSKADTLKAVAECLAGLSPSCADLEKQLATEAATGAAHVGELLAMQGAANINIPVLGAVAWFHRGEVNFDMQSALKLLDDGKGMPISLYIGAQPVAAQGDRDKLLSIIASAYLIAGHHDAPAHILDVLSDPEAATEAQVEAMLPYQPEAQGKQGAGLTFEDALRITRGCTDYGGGYRGNERDFEIYQHGIQTVINALSGAASKGLADMQVRVLHAIGAKP